MFNILVIEDNKNMRKLICATLKQNGYSTFEAEDGEVGLDVLDTTHIDLIICDIMMPNMDGYEFTETLRDGHCETPIIIVTAKEQLVHNMMDNIKEEQVEKFIKSKKSEKERISKEKVNLELDIALSKSMMDFSLNVINPIAKDAKQFDSSDFFVYAESYNKKYLAKDDNNNLKEFSGTECLSSAFTAA